MPNANVSDTASVNGQSLHANSSRQLRSGFITIHRPPIVGGIGKVPVLPVDGTPGVTHPAEVPFLENFYSFRNDLMSQSDIDALRSGRTQPTTGDATPGKVLADSAEAWLDAIESWQFGNAEFSRHSYSGASDAYDQCQQAVLNYFSIFPEYKFQYTANTLTARVDELIGRFATTPAQFPDVWTQINGRRQLGSLADLNEVDWSPIGPWRAVYLILQANLGGAAPANTTIGPKHRHMLMDAPMLLLAALLAALARGEANHLSRQYAQAQLDFSRVLRNSVPVANSPTLFAPAILRCDSIETPYARLMLAETMLGLAEAQFKARQSVDDETDKDTHAKQLAALVTLAQDFNNRHISGDPTNSTTPFQHLVAALTYAGVFDVMAAAGDYVAHSKEALNTLHANVTSTVANGDVRSLTFRSLGKTVTLPTLVPVIPVGGAVAGLTSGTHPHESYVRFPASDGQRIPASNPRIYALLLQAQARLLQIWNGFNYLGYRDDYVPPWRFQYMLDRARYFSEHAKNAQRDYLNFLSNAENGESKEMSAAQNVELEKANVQIETARVDQATDEVSEAKQGQELAELHAKNAQKAADEYADFKNKADTADGRSLIGSMLDGELKAAEGAAKRDVWDATEGGLGLFNSIWGGSARFDAETAQRQMELHNLQRTADEAKIASSAAAKKAQAAQAGLIVAGLQRQAALLRHEFARQNLEFERNKSLNTEQWYRLAEAIRCVSDTYLRYAIQAGFLAQQAYNFEADRRLNVIRFDYDASDVGAMLAADFLLRDLDTLEQDLVQSQQTRLQLARYVLSLAREFPETLRTLAETGEVMFSMRLEQLERHFPGLLDLRISNVDLQPIALMDPTRASVELTHLGTGMVRLRSQPGASPLNNTDLEGGDWLSKGATDWPVKINVSGQRLRSSVA